MNELKQYNITHQTRGARQKLTKRQLLNYLLSKSYDPTNREIARHFGVNEITVWRRRKQIADQLREEGKKIVRGKILKYIGILDEIASNNRNYPNDRIRACQLLLQIAGIDEVKDGPIQVTVKELVFKAENKAKQIENPVDKAIDTGFKVVEDTVGGNNNNGSENEGE